MNEEKRLFIENLKARIMNWVIRILDFCESLPPSTSSQVIKYQLTKSATSTGANHRAACRARSGNEFFAKMSIAVEESDESEYWLEIISKKAMQCKQSELSWLIKENNEITKILATARSRTPR